MADTYLVSASLEFKSNASTAIGDLLQLFEKLDGAIIGAQTKLGTLSSEIARLAGASKGIGATVRALEGFNKIKLSPSILTDMEHVSSVARGLAEIQAQLARSAIETATAWREMARTTPRGPSFTPGTNAVRTAKKREGGVDLLTAGIGAQVVGQEGTTFFGDALKQEMAVRHELAALRQNVNVGDPQIAEARAAGEQITRDNPGVLLKDAVKAITESFNITGDLKEAIAAAPAMARAGYFYENAPGEHRGDHAYASIQATELMQRHIDPATGKVSVDAINRELQEQMRVYAATRGRAGPDQYLAAIKQSRAAGIVGNDQFTHEDLPAIMAAMGGSRTGTGQGALFNQLITGRMTEAASNALKKSGLLDKDAHYEGGKVTDIETKLHGWRGVAENPVQWIRDQLLGPQGVLASNNISATDKIGISKFLADFASRQTGLGLLSEMTLGMPGIDKEAQKVREAPRDPLEVLRKNDPEQQVREYKAAQNEMMLSLGKEALGPAIEALKLLTTGIRDISGYLKAHPELGRDITLIGGGLAVMATGAGQLATVLFLGAPLVKGIGALASAVLPFGPGASAEVALATVAGVGVGSLASLAAAAIALPIALSSAANALGIKNEQGAGGGGKGLAGPGGYLHPSGPLPNQFGPLGDFLSKGFQGFSSQPSYAPHGRDLRHPSSMIAPPAAAPQPLRVSLNMNS